MSVPVKLIAAVSIAGSAILMTGCTEQVRGVETSMLPTIRSGELVDLDPRAYDDAQPKVGDVVALVAPAGFERDRCVARHSPLSPCPLPLPEIGEERLIKRVVAGPGDSIAVASDGGVLRNGQLAPEPYILRCRPHSGCGLPKSVVVPADYFFVMGDNRPVSSDSRYWGPIPLRAIEGKVTPLR